MFAASLAVRPGPPHRGSRPDEFLALAVSSLQRKILWSGPSMRLGSVSDAGPSRVYLFWRRRIWLDRAEGPSVAMLAGRLVSTEGLVFGLTARGFLCLQVDKHDGACEHSRAPGRWGECFRGGRLGPRLRPPGRHHERGFHAGRGNARSRGPAEIIEKSADAERLERPPMGAEKLRRADFSARGAPGLQLRIGETHASARCQRSACIIAYRSVVCDEVEHWAVRGDEAASELLGVVFSDR